MCIVHASFRCSARFVQVLALAATASAPVFLHVYDVGHSKTVKRINEATKLTVGGIFHGAIEARRQAKHSLSMAKSDYISCTAPAGVGRGSGRAPEETAL